MRLRSSFHPSPVSFSSSFSFVVVLLRPAASASSSFPPPLQGRHRLRRPPLNQVSDYLLEIDFTCSARFCICTSAPVRRTSAIVPDITGVSPFGFVLSSSSAPSSSSSHPRRAVSLLLTFRQQHRFAGHRRSAIGIDFLAEFLPCESRIYGSVRPRVFEDATIDIPLSLPRLFVRTLRL